ncbi:hypothetical protein LINPERHAP1_LOCUS5109, partial [Linum perenne]
RASQYLDKPHLQAAATKPETLLFLLAGNRSSPVWPSVAILVFDLNFGAFSRGQFGFLFPRLTEECRSRIPMRLI